MASFSGIKNTLLAEQTDEEVAPAHGPNPKKQQGPGAICSGACCHFLWKKIMLSGALRRLFFVHRLCVCGDYDDAHRFLLSTEIGRSTKCSAYVADISGLFACQLTCIHSFLA